MPFASQNAAIWPASDAGDTGEQPESFFFFQLFKTSAEKILSSALLIMV